MPSENEVLFGPYTTVKVAANIPRGADPGYLVVEVLSTRAEDAQSVFSAQSSLADIYPQLKRVHMHRKNKNRRFRRIKEKNRLLGN